jgi:enamine deaminase RidA (YjgF/YER057c/UK114 family)
MIHPATKWSVAILSALIAAPLSAAEVHYLYPDGNTGSSQAVIVTGAALAHTAQLLPLDADGKLVGDDAAAQLFKVLDNLDSALRDAGTDLDHAVKINVYVPRPQLVPEVHKALRERFRGGPAVSFVETTLPIAGALVAMDAIAVVKSAKGAEVKRLHCTKLAGGGSHAAILPAGPMVYVSGQASPNVNDVALATRQTLETLSKTLEHLKVNDNQVVQLKAFLKPMSAAGEVEKEIARYFGKQPVPSLVFVEWQMDLPIEIELIAASPPPKEKPAEALEFITPPGMQASPVYSRVARVNHGKLIYISGLYGKTPDKAEAQLQEIFATLGTLLEKSGSDWKHLAKATYYVSDDEASKKLNELRPKYYDPKRPPAASKAVVAGVGIPARSVTLDMIAVAPQP